MSPQLREVLVTVRRLSRHDQFELLQVMATELRQEDMIVQANTRFWKAQTLDEIVQSQSAQVVKNLSSLKASFWPEDEMAEDFNRFIAERREADRARQA